MLGQHRHTSKTPFKWCLAGGPMIACLYWYLDPSSPHHEKKQKKRQSFWQNLLDPRMSTC